MASSKIYHPNLPIWVESKPFNPCAKRPKNSNGFDYSNLGRLCLRGLHYQPLPNEIDPLFKYLDMILRKSVSEDESLKKSHKLSSIDQILNAILTDRAVDNLNGLRTNFFIICFCCELIKQGQIKDFIYTDGPLNNYLADRSKISQEQAQFLDSCGIDFLIKTNDDKYIPIQIKSNASNGFTGDISLPTKKLEFERLKQSLTEFTITENSIRLRRDVPVFNFRLTYNNENNHFDRFIQFINSLSNAQKQLDLGDDLNKLSFTDILIELYQKGYIKKTESSRFFAKNSSSPITKNCVSKHTRLENILTSQDDYLAKQSFKNYCSSALQHNAQEPNLTPRTYLDLILYDLQSLRHKNEMIVPPNLLKRWFNYLLHYNKLGPAMQREIKEIETLFPNSDLNVNKFLYLRKELISALILDLNPSSNTTNESISSLLDTFHDNGDLFKLPVVDLAKIIINNSNS